MVSRSVSQPVRYVIVLCMYKSTLLFTARRSYASAVLVIVILSVRPPVCLSVTRVLRDEIKEHTADILIPYHSDSSFLVPHIVLVESVNQSVNEYHDYRDISKKKNSKDTLQNTESRKTGKSCTIFKTAQFSISSEKSVEIEMQLQTAEDCSKCAHRQQERSGRQWSCTTLVGRSVPPSKVIAVVSEGRHHSHGEARP